MTKYIGITIGPIDRIATYAKSIRSIWASSYIFSFLAKELLTKLGFSPSNDSDFNPSALTIDKRFITPIISSDMWVESPIGRFPDQYIFMVNDDFDIKKIGLCAKSILNDLANEIARDLSINNDDEILNVKNYINRIIKVYAVEKVINDKTYDDAKIVSEFQQMFAAMECFDTYQQEENRNYLAEYFQTKVELLANRTASTSVHNKRMFKTILEVSGVINALEANLVNKGSSNINLKSYQKYIAFVAADGDNFGKTIAKLEEKSKYFTDFSSKLREAVASYGGQTIFQGGDDILFFAPTHNPDSELSKGNNATDVSTDGTSTHNPNNSSKKDDSEEKITDIFSLIKYIDDLFEEMVIKKLKEKDENGKCVWDGLKDKPSLSYGVAIAYYKHPMNEIRQRANDLLYKCKNDYNRNTIAWEVCKHSGQTFSGVIDKKEEKPEEKGQSVFAQMLSLISKSIPKPNLTKAGEDIDNNFLHSITHWIMSHKEIIESVILKNPQKEKLLENYFNNNFNEDSHKSKKEFIEAIREFLLIGNLKEPCANLHAILRYVELLINKSEHGK